MGALGAEAGWIMSLLSAGQIVADDRLVVARTLLRIKGPYFYQQTTGSFKATSANVARKCWILDAAWLVSLKTLVMFDWLGDKYGTTLTAWNISNHLWTLYSKNYVPDRFSRFIQK